MNTKNEWISVSGRLLGALFYFPPNAEQLEPIKAFFQQSGWQSQWQNFENQQLAQQISEGLVSTELEWEYQCLFVGPNQLVAPPWGSVYLDHESVVFGESLIHLRDFLQQHQVEFTANQNEPEDHFGLMLMLAAYFAENRPELLSEFLSKHLFTWSDRYLELLISTEDSAFYQGIAKLTQLTLEQWKSDFALQIPKVQLYF